jgi:hypothetical protein
VPPPAAPKDTFPALRKPLAEGTSVTRYDILTATTAERGELIKQIEADLVKRAQAAVQGTPEYIAILDDIRSSTSRARQAISTLTGKTDKASKALLDLARFIYASSPYGVYADALIEEGAPDITRFVVGSHKTAPVNDRIAQGKGGALARRALVPDAAASIRNVLVDRYASPEERELMELEERFARKYQPTESDRSVPTLVIGPPDVVVSATPRTIKPRAPSITRGVLRPDSELSPLIRTTGGKSGDYKNLAERFAASPPGSVIARVSNGVLMERYRELQAILSEWNKLFTPERKILLIDDGQYTVLTGRSPGRAKGGFGVAFIGGEPVSVIHLSEEEFATSPTTPVQSLAHEFGHHLVYTRFDAAPERVSTAIRTEYYRWFKEGAERIRSLTTRASAPFVPFEIRPGQDPHWYEYTLSFNEFMAQQFARYMAKKLYASAGQKSKLGRFLSRVITDLEKFFSTVLHELWKPRESFEEWIDILLQEASYFEDALNFLPEPWMTSSSDSVNGFQRLAQQSPEDWRPIHDARDKFGWLIRYVTTILQLARLNPHIPGLQEYVSLTQDWWAYKSKFTSRADEVLTQWRKLGRGRSDRLGRFLFELTLRSEELARRLSLDEVREIAGRYALDLHMQELFLSIDKTFRDFLEEMYSIALEDIQRIWAGRLNSPEFLAIKKALDDDFSRLRNRNYFPLARFGRWTISVRATKDLVWNGKEFRKGSLVNFETYEKSRLADARLSDIRREFPSSDFRVTKALADEKTFVFQGLPPAVVEMMENELGLTPEQRIQLTEIFTRLSPSVSFRKHLLKRKGIAGFAQEAERAFANYFLHGSNHLARMKYFRAMREAVDSVTLEVPTDATDVDLSKRDEIRQALDRHYDFLMTPRNELEALRGFVFTWFFFGNVKAAVVNLTQVPMFTYPWLAARHGGIGKGDVRAVAAIAQAIKDVPRALRKPETLKAWEWELIRKADEGGFLNESYAQEVAAQAKGNLLTRNLAVSGPGHVMAKITRFGVAPFAAAELVNRRITYLAAIRLRLQDDPSLIESETGRNILFEYGREAVQATQFEYAKFNRMELARGKKAVFFIFKTYLQHALFFALTDPGRWRYLGMLLVLAGLQGLPGADDLLDLYDAAATTIGYAGGLRNPHSDVRKDLREIFQELGEDPDSLMHGLGRETFGLAGLDLGLGVPIPALDFSGSLGLGRIVPGMEGVLKAATAGAVGARIDLNDFLVRLGTDVGGAAFGVGADLLLGLTATDTPLMQRIERVVPAGIRSVIRASRYWNEGEAQNFRGDRLVRFDPNDPEDMAEIVGQFLSMQPTRISQVYERQIAQREAAIFYTSWREGLLADFAIARASGEREAMSDVRKGIARFNRQVPPPLRISGDDLAASLRSRVKNKRLRELGLPSAKRLLGLYREIGAAYPVNEE